MWQRLSNAHMDGHECSFMETQHLEVMQEKQSGVPRPPALKRAQMSQKRSQDGEGGPRALELANGGPWLGREQMPVHSNMNQAGSYYIS